MNLHIINENIDKGVYNDNKKLFKTDMKQCLLERKDEVASDLTPELVDIILVTADEVADRHCSFNRKVDIILNLTINVSSILKLYKRG